MNNDSRFSNSVKNISFGLLAQLSQMILGFVSRTIFIKFLAVEYLGVNGLFTNILSLLSLAELGIAGAISYSFYKPLAEKDEEKIASLINFSAKIYTSIAIIVAILGLLVVPFLDDIVKNPPQELANDLVIIYLLFLFNTVSAYFLQYKISIFQADQRSFIVFQNNALFFFLQNVFQIVVLILFKNFIFYLIIQTVFQLLGNLVLSLKVNKYYPFLKKYKAVKLDSESKKQIYSNVKANSFIKIGGILVNSTDNLILNYFSGIAMVGLLSNYNLLIGLGSSLIVQVFSSLTASVANINAIESQDKKIETFNLINFMNFWIYGFFSVAILFLINDFILIWIGQNYVLPLSVVVLLVINFYMYGMQNAVWMFKFTLGIFKQGQYIILFTALINLVLSFIFGYYYGLVGILAATAIARMVTNAWFDPYIVFKLGLNLNPLHYLIKYIKYLLILVLSIAVIRVIMNYVTVNGLLLVVIKVIVVMITPNIFIILFYRNNADFKNLMSMLNVLIKKFTTKTA